MGLHLTIDATDVLPACVSIRATIAGADLNSTATLIFQEVIRRAGGPPIPALLPLLTPGAQVRAWWEREDGLVLWRYVAGELVTPSTTVGDPQSLYQLRHTITVRGWSYLLDVLGVTDPPLDVPAGTFPVQVATVIAYFRSGAAQPIDGTTYVQDLAAGATLPAKRYAMRTLREIIDDLCNQALIANPNLRYAFTIAASQVLYDTEFDGPYLYCYDRGYAPALYEFGTAAVVGGNIRPMYGQISYAANVSGLLYNAAAVRNVGGRVITRSNSAAQALVPNHYSPDNSRLRIVRDSSVSDTDLPDESLRQATKDAFAAPQLQCQLPLFLLPQQGFTAYVPPLVAADPAWASGKDVVVESASLAWDRPQGGDLSQPLVDTVCSTRQNELPAVPKLPLDLYATVPASAPAVVGRNKVKATQPGVEGVAYHDRLTDIKHTWVDNAGHHHPVHHNMEFKSNTTHRTTFSFAVYNIQILEPSPLPSGMTVTATLDTGSGPVAVTFPIATIPAHGKLDVTVAGLASGSLVTLELSEVAV